MRGSCVILWTVKVKGGKQVMKISRLQVICLGTVVSTAGLAIVLGMPLSDELLGWVWLVWGMLTIVTSFFAKNLDSWF